MSNITDEMKVTSIFKYFFKDDGDLKKSFRVKINIIIFYRNYSIKLNQSVTNL